jgi:hypothetical protein
MINLQALGHYGFTDISTMTFESLLQPTTTTNSSYYLRLGKEETWSERVGLRADGLWGLEHACADLRDHFDLPRQGCMQVGGIHRLVLLFNVFTYTIQEVVGGVTLDDFTLPVGTGFCGWRQVCPLNASFKRAENRTVLKPCRLFAFKVHLRVIVF